MRRLVPIFLVLCAFAFALAALAQQPIRVNVSLVNVSFTARDPQGKLVNSLTRNDIELFEDAVPQKIEFFSRSTDLPLTLALIVDASGSQEHFGKKHEKDLEVFLKEVLGPNDRAFLVCFGNHLRLVSDYTNSPSQIIENYKAFDKGKARFPEIGPSQDRELGTAFYDSIYYSVTQKLRGVEGRRAILMFSDGEDNSSSHDMMSTIEAAQLENVVVYTIRYTESRHGDLTARNEYGIRVMDRIARETGGRHIDGAATDPHTYFREIAEELRSSYEVGYYPANSSKDDTFRKIVIRPKDSSIRIRTKTGYFAK